MVMMTVFMLRLVRDRKGLKEIVGERFNHMVKGENQKGHE